LAADLARRNVEVVARPLAVIRREALSALGMSQLSARLASDTVALSRLIRQHDVALVHSNTSVVLGGASAARATGVPHVWHVREIYDRWGRLFRAHRRLLAGAAALPCVSVAASLQFGRAEPVRVIHDGLAISPVRTQRSVARAKLGLPHDRPVIAVVGRITDWKGQDLLVRALAAPELRERGAVGLLAGDVWPGADHRREAVLALAAELDVADRLVLPGFIEPIADVYGAADVIAVPSTAPDPLPGSALEAAAAGCAVIAAAHGGLPEIITDGLTGLLVPPGDVEALVSGLTRLVEHARLRATLGSAASLDVRRRFAPERLHRSIQALYRELIPVR
jgi:glycosyltransferase involved in cell wall biosynthesis